MRIIAKNVKPLYQINHNRFLAFSSGKIGVFDIDTKEFIRHVNVPMSYLKKISSDFRLMTRMLRLEPRCAAKISPSLYVFSFKGHVYLYDLLHRSLTLEHCFRRGMNNPLFFTEVKGIKGFSNCILYGEYFTNEGKKETSIFQRGLNKNDRWGKVFTFDRGEINHIHKIIPDKYRNCLWILTGDDGEGAGIWIARNEFQEVRPILRGRQKYRLCAMAIYQDYLLCCTDTPMEKNSLYMITDMKLEDNLSCKMIELDDIPGPCIYSEIIGGKDFIFSTSVEPDAKLKGMRYLLSNRLGSGIKDRKTYLFCYKDKKLINLGSEEKDIFPMGLFQFGYIQFPDQNIKSKIHCFFNGTKKTDGYWMEVDICDV